MLQAETIVSLGPDNLANLEISKQNLVSNQDNINAKKQIYFISIAVNAKRLSYIFVGQK